MKNISLPIFFFPYVILILIFFPLIGFFLSFFFGIFLSRFYFSWIFFFIFFFSGEKIFSSCQFDSNSSSRHFGTSQTGKIFRTDFQRHFTLHFEHLWSLWFISVSILSSLQQFKFVATLKISLCFYYFPALFDIKSWSFKQHFLW